MWRKGVFRDNLTRGRDAAGKGETEIAYPSYPVFDDPDPVYPSARYKPF
jgi:hypothetical protein